MSSDAALIYDDACRAAGTPPLDAVLDAFAVAPLGVLDARRARVGDADCAALGETVLAAGITALHASHNAIGDAGVAALVDGMRCEALSTVDLSHNELGPAGGAALCAALGAAPAL